MNIKYLYLIVLVSISISCGNVNKKAELSNKETVINETNENALTLLKNNCYACHSVTSTSHDEIIAPPMVAIVRRYKMSYQNKEAFVEGVSNWVLNPIEEKALMRGAVSQFNIMPKQPFNKSEIITIAEYMYDNELETPPWFEAHFNEEHPNGMGQGQGQGQGKGMGNGYRGGKGAL